MYSNHFKKWYQIGQFIGRYNELSEFIRQRYIYVSRITAGAKSNELGQLLQRHIYLDLQTKLGQQTIDIKRVFRKSGAICYRVYKIWAGQPQGIAPTVRVSLFDKLC